LAHTLLIEMLFSNINYKKYGLIFKTVFNIFSLTNQSTNKLNISRYFCQSSIIEKIMVAIVGTLQLMCRLGS